jgi:hypothetical protein
MEGGWRWRGMEGWGEADVSSCRVDAEGHDA